jgi:hypothetical protein
MRHLLGRAAFLACGLALISQPSFAVPVPKARPHHHDAATAAAADVPVPLLRPALDGDPAPVRVALADIPVPMARPDQAGDPPVADPNDLADDDADASAADKLAQAEPPPDLSGDDAPRIETPDHRLNCVAYVRERSGFAIQGDAHLWWEHAEGTYDRAPSPSENAVMVFAATRSMRKGHVAVVTKLVSDRQIIVDHANWMRDGRVYLNMPVMDVSPDNDWSQVRVWNARDGQWGSRVYPIRGFVSARATS